MLPLSSVEERLHVACFTALAAEAGLNANPTIQDQGIDFYLQSYTQRGGVQNVPTGIAVPIQLKATIRWQINGEFFIFDLKADAYNKLANSTPPTILVVMPLPVEQGFCKVGERDARRGMWLRNHR